MFERLGMRVNPVVFFVSAGIILLFVVMGAAYTDATNGAFGAIQRFIVIKLGWFYIFSVTFFLGFVLWLLFSRHADVRLGADHDRPEFGTMSWFAMLFSAGMGIGLLFFSVAEPIMHFTSPHYGGEPGSIEAARQAMKTTFFHWGLHAWGIYIVVGLSLAYFAYRRGLPLTVRSAFYPVLGDRVHGLLGDIIDILAVVSTMFGVATSLGLGVMQVNTGLERLGFMNISIQNQVLLIAGITLMATASVVSGVGRGIRRLSELNIILGLILLLFVFFAGPTAFLVSSLVQNTGHYLQDLVRLSFHTDAYAGADWQGGWTMFYWGWWISWSPFVGMFIARISKGRTIREFIMGVLLVPTGFGLVWLAIFGNTALHMELAGSGGIAEAVAASVPTALYVTLENLPLAPIMSLLATIVVITFFVTSSDSGSLVIDILTANGNPNPPVGQRIFWALTEGVVAAVLLLTSAGAAGLKALQTASITTALPFCAAMLVMCYSLAKGLRSERDKKNQAPRAD